MYSYEDVFNASKEYFHDDELAANVFVNKYCLQKDGVYFEKTPDDMHRRMAKEFARVEAKKFKTPLTEEYIYQLFYRFRKIVPQGSPMFGIGNPYQITSLSNCYVVDSPKDSYGSICKTDQEIVQISKRRGGIGYDISNIRPKNCSVNNAARTTTGAVSFMHRFSNTGREVGQGGRRAAQMITIDVHHPDIEEFISVKADDVSVTGANISVRLSDEFLNAVEENKDYELRWPVQSDKPKISLKKNARDIWDKIVHYAWLRAEPGILFWNKIIEECPANYYKDFGFLTISTNPCQPAEAKILTPYGEKSVGSLNIGDIILTDEGFANITNKVSTDIKNIYKYVTQTGYYFLGTKNHIVLNNGQPIEIDKTEDIDTCDWTFVYNEQTYDYDIAVNFPRSTNIIRKEFLGKQETFCITVDNDTNTYITSGCKVKNCGEITLSAYDSCRLLAINLWGYIKYPFTKEAYFDYASFYDDAIVAQRLMDNLIDLELECIDKIIEKIKNDPEDDETKFIELSLWTKIRKACVDGRRTGLGITALGDVLAGLGIKYGSDASLDTTNMIYQFLKFASYESSVRMAEELGPFPVWNWDLEKDCPFIQRIANEEIGYLTNTDYFSLNGKDLIERIKKFGRRNIANLTTAPTGSLSMLCEIGYEEFIYNNTTSGIEPSFMLSYDRMKKGNPGDVGFRTDSIDQSGDHWMKFKIYHSGHKLWMDITKETDETKSPYYQACADDLTWTQRVKLQATAQLHVDHSISSTVNVPENVTKEEISEIYRTGWKYGCKGLTIYRKNCRTGVLVESKKEEQKIINNAKKRPDILPCDIYSTRIKGEKFFVLVSIHDDLPYEVFSGKEDFDLGSHEKGFLKKLSRGKYKLIGLNEEVICNNIVDYLTENEQLLTRLVSTALRHGTPLEFINHQIEKTSGDMQSSSKVIARILKKYIKDGAKVSGESCPNCQQDTLERMEGCVCCKQCGFSRC